MKGLGTSSHSNHKQGKLLHFQRTENTSSCVVYLNQLFGLLSV